MTSPKKNVDTEKDNTMFGDLMAIEVSYDYISETNCCYECTNDHRYLKHQKVV